MTSEERAVIALERIASALEALANCVESEKSAFRMFDCERGKVYATHLGKKLSESQVAEK